MERHEPGLPAEMRDLLDRGGTILTANARAARALDRHFAQSQQAQGRSAWPASRILDLHAWLHQQWEVLLLTGTEDRLLLNEVQEHALWQRILAPQLVERSLLEPARMATLAQEAYALLVNYGALGRLNEPAWGTESRAEPELMRGWARSFEKQCARHRWLPRCKLIEVITHALRWGQIAPPVAVGWLGFDQDTPAQRELIAALEAIGAPSQTLSWRLPRRVPPSVLRAQGEGDEAMACAAWAHAHLAADPNARIGILMPDLANRRAQLERALYRQINAAAFPITAGGAPPLSFEFSLGQPLAQVPMVHAALLLLRWLHAPLAQQEISWLLLSSTLGSGQGDAARDALARWDSDLRNVSCAPPEISLDALLRRTRTGRSVVRALHDDFSAMLQTHRRTARAALPGEWVQRIRHLLQVVRWGVVANVTSLLHQAHEAWESLLDTVASLDVTGQSLAYRDFLSTLEGAARDTIFAPESADAPVQVIGAYAASGLSFDAVWFLGATDSAWPADGQPHPLLPLYLQREFGMPHASPESNYQLAHRVTERILQGAGEVVFSYSTQTTDALQRGSSLIETFALATAPVTQQAEPAILLESSADDTWVPFPPGKKAPGGQKALKRQADCPFQAFVFQRLHVREMRVAGRGLSPLARGILLHDVMQDLWSKDLPDLHHLKSHADLIAATGSGSLETRVTAHAAARLARLDADTSERWQRTYMAAEQERVVRLVMGWLEVESARQPFTVVEVEKEIPVQVGELPLDIRADRIDQVAEGRLLIDYKTGEVTAASWEGERPKEPQLPLYAAFGNVDELVGAVFAQIRRPDLVFKGRVTDPHVNLDLRGDKQIEPYTAETVAEWRHVLVQLAGNFVRGDALIDPHIYPKTCDFCPLPGVCRVAELRASGNIRVESDDEADTE